MTDERAATRPEALPPPTAAGDGRVPRRPSDDGAGGAPAPAPTKPAATRPDPTRYGDWEKNGRCIDF